MTIHLDARLSLAASFVRSGSVVADIGTDHAYLPVHLVETGVCPRAFACDKRTGPLQNAKQTVEAAGLSDRITTLLSDGLDALPPGCADDVVLAGMGGILIAELLNRAAWLKNESVRVIVQPMSHAEDVRLWLFENTGETAAYTSAMLYGGTLFGKDDQAAKRLLNNQLQRLKKRRDALLSAQSDPQETARLCAVIDDFERRMQHDNRKSTI